MVHSDGSILGVKHPLSLSMTLSVPMTTDKYNNQEKPAVTRNPRHYGKISLPRHICRRACDHPKLSCTSLVLLGSSTNNVDPYVSNQSYAIAQGPVICSHLTNNMSLDKLNYLQRWCLTSNR